MLFASRSKRAAIGISGEVIGKDFDRDASSADQAEDFVGTEPRAHAERQHPLNEPESPGLAN